LIFNKLKL